MNNSITIGGFWTIPNLAWDANANQKCDIQKVDVCQPIFWRHHDQIIISCFADRLKMMNWSMTILHAINNLTQIVPNDAINYETLLPFPNLFNVTIENVKQSASICPKSNSVTCHMRMRRQGQCSFY